MDRSYDEDGVPGLAPPDASRQWPVQRLTVDGEVFDVHTNPTHPGSHHYDWISGPNPHYGFGSTSSALQPSTRADHEHAIREFLAMIDPHTGYIADTN